MRLIKRFKFCVGKVTVEDSMTLIICDDIVLVLKKIKQLVTPFVLYEKS